MFKIAHHPIYDHPLSLGHRFPMEKYTLLPQQLISERCCLQSQFFEPEIPNDKYIVAVHDPEYFYDLLNLKISPKHARKIGFPLSRALVRRERIIVDGTLKCCSYALEDGISMNIAGGTHHAFTDHGEAFCMLNDQAIGAKYLQAEGLAQKILMIDLDVHQGNGTAEIFRDDSSVFTFSMHGEGNYPYIKERSDFDIGLPKGTGDNEYLSTLADTLVPLLERVAPDFVFYLCGADVLESDRLGTLSLTLDGCRKRDRLVLENCRDLGIPVQCSMGGGYSKDLKILVEAHANTFRVAKELYFCKST
ncbi:MAG: histone deacetylase [Sediminicola sp.]